MDNPKFEAALFRLIVVATHTFNRASQLIEALQVETQSSSIHNREPSPKGHSHDQ